MKAILMSIRPQHSKNILNKIKTIEIRKRFPSDYVGWVYIYCTKGKPFLFQEITYEALAPFPHLVKHPFKTSNYCPELDTALNGKVIARFWCDKVESFEFCEFSKHKDNRELYNECVIKDNELCKKACISCVQMVQYLDTKAIGKDMFGKAIHITKLEIFDKPKEIKEFGRVVLEPRFFNGGEYYEEDKHFLTRAPQSYCFIEV